MNTKYSQSKKILALALVLCFTGSVIVSQQQASAELQSSNPYITKGVGYGYKPSFDFAKCHGNKACQIHEYALWHSAVVSVQRPLPDKATGGTNGIVLMNSLKANSEYNH